MSTAEIASSVLTFLIRFLLLLLSKANIGPKTDGQTIIDWPMRRGWSQHGMSANEGWRNESFGQFSAFSQD